MVMLTFRLGDDRYGLDVACVTKVLPLVELKAVPHAPPYVAGLADLQGLSLPVIDLCMLAVGRKVRPAMSTRIIQVHYPGLQSQAGLGLLAEAVSEVLRVDEEAMGPTGVVVPETPYLGQIFHHEGRLLQKVELDDLLPDDVLRMLTTAG